MADDGESLESWLNKATNPFNREDDWEYIMGFCDQVNVELEGPQIATKLIAHKMQSPQEMEALQSLTVLESCVKNCGRRFHQEIGKFRFLNEMIKLVSPKYLGEKTSEKVKTKVIELLYCWSTGLPHEAKIGDAYKMLKKQGIVTTDPTYVDKTYEPPPPPRPKDTLFEDEDKAKLLDRLLKSKNQEDLQAANRLIKNMVKEDANRMEKVSRRLTELEMCNNNVKLLNEMLAHYTKDVTSSQEIDLMKELYEACEKMRPKLFTLASDADDKDDGLNDILQANDSLVKVMESFKLIVEGVETNLASPIGRNISTLIDMDAALMTETGMPLAPSGETTSSDATANGQQSHLPASSSALLLEDELSALGLNENTGTSASQQPGSSINADLNDVFASAQAPAQASNIPSAAQATAATVGLLHQQQRQMQLQQQMAMPFSSFPVQQNYAAYGGMHPTATSGISMGATGIGGPTQGYMQTRPMMNTMPTRQHVPPTTTTETKPSPFDDLDVLSKSMVETPKTFTQQQPKQLAMSTQPVMKPMQPSVTGNMQQPSQQPMQSSLSQPAMQTLVEPVPQSLIQVAPTPQPVQPKVAMPPPVSQQVTQPTPGSPAPNSLPSTPVKEVVSLADVFVPLESVQPGTQTPITVYDKNNIRTLFHFAKNSPRPDVLVVVISTMSSHTSPVKNVVFQAAVPRVMKVKLQPPSASELPAFNPILPAAAITQVMLLANPNKEKIRLKFKLMYQIDNEKETHLGEVSNFPEQS
ncbi:ADP-ribosylation factor-binding protein GGA1-like [Saccoglossus kowalevskii]|uniref:ADP-ribosylation factor-binding protein GGA3-like isoform X2 n=1 Tax=Saccoglossus kowalevskii TaxID=10224 RepID=A0ABM0MWN8_SACKO|nr:PREDICTED: ADP-ribosylation factor-binding protein GGA3-like isoform X2 [Saccoglossus kowalevskii]